MSHGVCRNSAKTRYNLKTDPHPLVNCQFQIYMVIAAIMLLSCVVCRNSARTQYNLLKFKEISPLSSHQLTLLNLYGFYFESGIQKD